MTMQTSLESIAKKAKEQSNYRFRDLSREINEDFLRHCWYKLNKRSAVGVDRISYKDYDSNLEANLKDLVERLKRGAYRAKLVRRHYIPKGNGKQRPLGIPSTEDKLLQYAVSQILQAIHEQDFLPSSFGYRPNVGAKDAVKELQRVLTTQPFHWVVEADIRGFFDNINHDKLIEMIEKRVDDKRFIRLIRKWLNAGVLDTDGQVLHPVAGTPQGGVISPVLANIYMHYALNLWFEDVVKKHCGGKSHICVYADDFVCAFERKEDADRFYEVLSKRLGKYSLEVAPEKTNKIQFSRFGGKKNGSFEFLGFEFRWERSNISKKFYVKLSTSQKKFNNSIKTLGQWCREMRSLPLNVYFKKLNMKLRGYYNYYGVIGNSDRTWKFDYLVGLILFKWLNRRSQRKSYNWNGFNDLLKCYPFVRPNTV